MSPPPKREGHMVALAHFCVNNRFLLEKKNVCVCVCVCGAGLTDSCRDCANNCLHFLKDLKLQASLQRADSTAIRYAIQRILALGQVGDSKRSGVIRDIRATAFFLSQLFPQFHCFHENRKKKNPMEMTGERFQIGR